MASSRVTRLTPAAPSRAAIASSAPRLRRSGASFLLHHCDVEKTAHAAAQLRARRLERRRIVKDLG